MILSTTPTLQGKEINEYLGLVTAEAIMGAHIGRDILASLRDVFGGRAKAYEKVIIDAKEEVLRELKERAGALNADAVVGIDFDFEVVGQNGSMLMVSISGTAVKLK